MIFLLRQGLRFMVMLIGISLLAFTFSRFAQTQVSEQLLPQLLPQQSFIQGYLSFLTNMFSGDFGLVQHNHQAVEEAFLNRLAASAELMFPAIIFAWLLGIPLAIWAAQKPLSPVDKLVQILGVSTYSLPVFWLGLILLLFFATGLEWFPIGGRLDYVYDIPAITGSVLIDTLISEQSYAGEAFVDALHHMVLPLLTLTVLPMAYVALQLRASMEEVHQQEFIMAAHSRGLSKKRILWMHSLPNAIQPVVASMSLQFSTLVTSLIIIENLYSWPGVGHWFLILVQQQDFSALRGALMLIGTVILLLNMATEFLRFLVTPSLRRA